MDNQERVLAQALIEQNQLSITSLINDKNICKWINNDISTTDLVGFQSSAKNTKCLPVAFFNSDIKTCKTLVQLGASIDGLDSNGSSLLIWGGTSEFDREKKVSYLLENGLDVNHANKIGHTPIIAACDSGHLGSVK